MPDDKAFFVFDDTKYLLQSRCLQVVHFGWLHLVIRTVLGLMSTSEPAVERV